MNLKGLCLPHSPSVPAAQPVQLWPCRESICPQSSFEGMVLTRGFADLTFTEPPRGQGAP